MKPRQNCLLPVCVLLLLLALLVQLATGQTDQSVQAVVFSPTASAVVGVNGSGWLVDVAFAVTSASLNSLLFPESTFSFNNGLNASTPLRPGASAAAPGLVVVLSTTPNTTVFQGPTTNLAGLFQITAVADAATGQAELRASWFVGAQVFGVGVNSTLTAFLVSGVAPNVLPSTDFAALPNLISQIASVSFAIAGPVSVTANTSQLLGATAADPDAVVMAVLAPQAGDVVGVSGVGWLVDLAFAAAQPQFNPLLSPAAGYLPLFDNGTVASISRPGFNIHAPGLVVLLNTTASIAGTAFQGPQTNLAGLFQMISVSAIPPSGGSDGLLNELLAVWLVGKAAFGSGPSQLTVFLLNTTAPALLQGQPEAQPDRISAVSTVDFVIAGSTTGTTPPPPASSSGAAGPSSSGAAAALRRPSFLSALTFTAISVLAAMALLL
jgi:hypothetical protein